MNIPIGKIQKTWPVALVLAVAAIAGKPCDTWVALPDSTSCGYTILAKNSDRTLLDCQPLYFHARQAWPAGADLDLGRITIPQAAESYATLGSSPYWCWGYEEGINEHGVAIGNEGIWTKALVDALAASRKGKGPERGPTGMDLVRLGLERGRPAREALDVIAAMTEKFGQFGSGLPGVDLEGAYENSYIIADPTEAWILETTGKSWAARKFTEGFTSISNVTSLGTDLDRLSADLIDRSISKGWWPERKAGAFDFSAACRADETPAVQARNERAMIRAARSRLLLEQKAGAVGPEWMMRIARDRGSSPSIDLDVTASSCVAVLPSGTDSLPLFWWCPAVPSKSCYVPFFVHGSRLPPIVSTAGCAGRRIVPPREAEPDRFSAHSYWWVIRDLCDTSSAGVKDRTSEIRGAFDPLEKEFAAQVPSVIRDAVALRKAGDEKAAARLLDDFTASCVDKVLHEANALRLRFNEETDMEIPDKYKPYVGKYLATINSDTVTVLVRNGHLAVDIPRQMVCELKDPDSADKWYLVLTDQIAVSFVENGKNEVVAMYFHQGGLDFELVREGIELPAEIDLDEARKYLGRYRSDKYDSTVRIFFQNNRLALDWPGRMIFELRPPDKDGVWAFRLGEVSAIRFKEDKEGRIVSVVHLRDGVVDDELPRVGDD